MAGAPQKRSSWTFLLGLALVLLSVPAAYFLFLRAPPPPPPPPPPKVAAVPDAGHKVVEIRLGQLQGKVEIRRAGTTQWTTAAEGDTVSPADGVRTADGSYALLVGGEAWEVKMEPGTEVGIGELSDSISRILLDSGMAKATVRPGARHTFEVRAANSDAVASTDGGVFTIASNGQGTVAVGAEQGEVRFLGKGRVVIVKAGQESILRPGQDGPSAPAAIPSSLLLKVALPNRLVVNTPTLVLKGQTAPGAQVEVAGRVVRSDAEGRFEAKVPLTEGKNALTVKARDVGGVTTTATHNVERDTTVKTPTIDPNLWK